ncbi:hypothetical protein ACFPAA_02905, partial [Paraburkholderia caffeinitolerans]|uniref:hypothetical protein n=1 Tax=Paraburkholderia caffeinitolerans TaxID=1723730 RepID=UPI0036098F69
SVLTVSLLLFHERIPRQGFEIKRISLLLWSDPSSVRRTRGGDWRYGGWTWRIGAREARQAWINLLFYRNPPSEFSGDPGDFALRQGGSVRRIIYASARRLASGELG